MGSYIAPLNEDYAMPCKYVSKATNTSRGTSVYDDGLRQRRRVERNGRRGSHVGEYCVGGRKVSGRESGSAALSK